MDPEEGVKAIRIAIIGSRGCPRVYSGYETFVKELADRKKTAINVDGLEWPRPKWKSLGPKYLHWTIRMATELNIAP